MVAECLDRNRGKRDRAAAAGNLGLHEDPPHAPALLESPFDRQTPGIKVDGLPFQAQRLPHSQASGGQYNPEDMQPITTAGCGQDDQLISSQRRHLPPTGRGGNTRAAGFRGAGPY